MSVLRSVPHGRLFAPSPSIRARVPSSSGFYPSRSAAIGSRKVLSARAQQSRCSQREAMMAHPMKPDQVESALARIGVDCHDVKASLESLGDLQAAFLRSVPFENQGIHEGQSLALDMESAYAKVVQQGNGGICFELNPLFLDLLRSLGFSAFLASSTMHSPDGQPGPVPGNHCVIVVTLPDNGGEFLVDAGNGLDLGAPVPLSGEYRTPGEFGHLGAVDDGAVQTFFSVGPVPYEPSNDTHALLIHSGETATVRYTFTLDPRDREDFRDAAAYTQDSPDSIFVQTRLASLRTPDGGRVTLAGQKLIITTPSGKSFLDVGDLAEQKGILAERFGLKY